MAWVEESVGVVYEAEQDGQSLFRSGESLGMVGVGHLLLIREGRLRWPLFYPQSTQHTSRPAPSLLHILPRNPRSVGRESVARGRLYFVGCATAYPRHSAKRALSARYALANSNRSMPYPDSSARNRTSEVIVFCTSELRRSLSTGVRERG
jgi:hypothetical protein